MHIQPVPITNPGTTVLSSAAHVPVVVTLDHAAATDPAVVGGKGAGLASLHRAGFRVPEARVITAAAYANWFEPLSRIVPRDLAGLDDSALERVCRDLRARLARHLPSREVDAALRPALERLLADGPLAVRSSATLEDLAGAAFAGQHDTVLGVRDVDAAIGAIGRCWLSLWHDRAVRYRLERDHAATAPHMAVVVQRMVDADVAGVAFTLDPVGGDTDRVTVNAARGLGESVVSGECDVDQWHVAKGSRETIDRHVGHQSHALVQGEHGTVRHALAPKEADAPCLDAHELDAVVALAERVEASFGFPQDIEWALADGELHLLQSRPITRFPARWTRDESAERFPDAITPLTWDFTAPGFHASLAHSLALMGLPPIEATWFERIDGHVYGNRTAISLYTRFAELELDDLDELDGRVPAWRRRFDWVQELPDAWHTDLARYRRAIAELSAVDVTTLGRPALARHLARIDRTGRDYFLPNIAISITQGLLYRTLHRIAALALGTEEAVRTVARLTAFCGTRTHEVNRDLEALCGLVREDDELTTLLTTRDGETLLAAGALGGFARFGRAFGDFLDEHGHRETDFDAFHPTWGERPAIVLDLLRPLVVAGGDEPDGEDAARREALAHARQGRAEARLLEAVPDASRAFVRELVSLCRRYTALDDIEHYETTRLTPPFRAALLEIGARLVGDGLCERASDVFFLSRATLERWLADATGHVDVERDGGLAREIETARTAHTIHLATDPVHDLGASVDDAPSTDAAGTSVGLAGSPGIAEGRVCIVRSPRDFARFEPGAILVARTTNPAWTPLFRSACAVITECGGPLSHGAVTAREVGIPAVLAVRGALERLQDGVRAIVDGGRGTVTLLDARIESA